MNDLRGIPVVFNVFMPAGMVRTLPTGRRGAIQVHIRNEADLKILIEEIDRFRRLDVEPVAYLSPTGELLDEETVGARSEAAWRRRLGVAT